MVGEVRQRARIRSRVGLYGEVPVERYQLLRRPYARPTSTRAAAFFWLVHRRRDGSRHVLDRGEGTPARDRIERLLRRLAVSSAPQARLAAQALCAGWEDRR